MLNEKRILDEFYELVQIRCSSRNERQIADLLTKRLEELGCTVTEDNAGEKIGGNTGNLRQISRERWPCPRYCLRRTWIASSPARG